MQEKISRISTFFYDLKPSAMLTKVRVNKIFEIPNPNGEIMRHNPLQSKLKSIRFSSVWQPTFNNVCPFQNHKDLNRRCYWPRQQSYAVGMFLVIFVRDKQDLTFAKHRILPLAHRSSRVKRLQPQCLPAFSVAHLHHPPFFYTN